MRFIGTSKHIDNMPKHSQEKCQLPQHTNMHAHTCFSHLETWGNGIDLRKQEKHTGQTWEKTEHKLWGRGWCRKAFSLQFHCFLLYLFFLSRVCELSWLLCICSPQSSLNHFRSYWKGAVHWPGGAFAFQGPVSLIAAAQYFNQYSEHNMPADKTQHVWQVISYRNTVTFSLC